DSDDHLGPGDTPCFRGFPGEEREDHRDFCAAVTPDEGDFTRLEQWVHRHRDGTDPQYRVIDDREIGHVRHDHRDPITGSDTPMTKSRRESGNGRIQAGIAQNGFALFYSWEAGVAGCSLLHPSREIGCDWTRRRCHNSTLVCS